MKYLSLATLSRTAGLDSISSNRSCKSTFFKDVFLTSVLKNEMKNKIHALEIEIN